MWYEGVWVIGGMGYKGVYCIRKFHHNVSSMKRLAARDFEDLLQVRLVQQFANF